MPKPQGDKLLREACEPLTQARLPYSFDLLCFLLLEPDFAVEFSDFVDFVLESLDDSLLDSDLESLDFESSFWAFLYDSLR